MHPEKSSLSIRLTEPVVSLRNTLDSASRLHDPEIPPPAIVRGLLTLRLAKATKISGIELELQATATTHHVQNAGPSRTDVTERYRVHSASMVVFKAGPACQERRRATSTRPKIQFPGHHTGSNGRHGVARPYWQALPEPVNRSASLDPRWITRRLSSDEYEIGRIPQRDQLSIDPVPPYPSLADCRAFLSADSNSADRSQSVTSSLRFSESPSSPIQSRDGLTLENLHGSPGSSAPSIRRFPLSRTSSIEEGPEDDNESRDSIRTSAISPDSVAYYGLSRIATRSVARSSERDQRGRSGSRFSFGKVVHVFEAVKERVRSRSPHSGSRGWSDDQERGRSLTKGKGKAQVGTQAPPQIGIPGPDDANDQSGDGWITFPKGTYIYPMFFTIPSNLPPTTNAEHGSLIWKVKAKADRPGALTPKMTAEKEVIVISVPNDSNPEEAEGIDLQQQWEERLHYRVQMTRRGVPVGGKIPFQLTIMPLATVKVHSIIVHLDERTEYYTRARSRARPGTIRRATLLVIKHNNSDHKQSIPILPLISDGPDAFRQSPLYRFLQPGEDENEVASSFIGPGPWTIQYQMNVPDSCSILHPSNQAKHSNITVNHLLKLVLRVEKGEGAVAAGKKLYDIVIHVPMQIFSCRCTSDWSSLPRYDETLRPEDHSPEVTTACPCRARHQAHGPGRDESSLTVAFDTDSLADCTHLHERLMTGLVSETGEAPPSYDCFGRHDHRILQEHGNHSLH